MRTTHPVTLARAYSGVTQTELGKLLGKSQTFIARLEAYEFETEPLVRELVKAFAEKGTVFPSRFFDYQSFLVPQSAVTYRKRSNCPAIVRDKATFYSEVVPTLVSPLIASFVRYPQVDVPSIPIDWGIAESNARSVGAEAARALRTHWSIGWGPISDVIKLVESRGVRVFYVRERSDHLDGFAFWSQDTPYIFLNSLQDDPARVRFDLAHELGHLVMHRELEMDVKSLRKSNDQIETMAHGFAAEFLAPWDTLKDEVPPIPNIDSLARLRRRWRMSMQAIVKQMHANGYLSDSAYTNAFRKFSSLGYRRGPEPVWITPDTSAIHKRFLEVTASQGLSVANLAEDVGINETLLADLIPQSTEQIGFSF